MPDAMWIHKPTHHLTDARLVEHHFADGVSGEDDGRAFDHLAACAPCTERYQTLVRQLDDLRAEGASLADSEFSPEALAQQHHEIMRRLENQGRRADIFIFPARLSRHVRRRTGTAYPVRWAAATAMVGLAAGLALGLTIDRLDVERPLPASTATVATPGSRESMPRAGRSSAASRSVAVEDALLDEIDAALLARRVPELLPYDELTPERVSINYRAR